MGFLVVMLIFGIVSLLLFYPFQNENTSREEFFNTRMSMLKNPDSKLRRKTVRTLLDNLGMQETQSYATEIIKLLLEALEDENWQIRCDIIRAFDMYFYQSIKQSKYSVINAEMKPLVINAYITSFTDSNPQVRVAAIKAFAKLYQPDFLNGFVKGNSYFTQEQFSRTVPELINALSDEDEKVCAAAASALKFSGAFEAIPPLLQALDNPSRAIPKKAISSLQELQKIIRVVEFGEQRDPEIVPKTLLNPDISEQCVPFLELREVKIHADTCDLALIERFCRYLQTAYNPELLRKQIRITINGNPLVFSPEAFAVLGRCRHVDVMLETAAFGDPDRLPSPYPHSLTNPDFTPLTLPCNHLRRVLIDAEHADFHLLERFLTYLLAYLGQAYLQEIEVTLYGDPSRLHPNIYNNIRNMFQHIIIHEMRTE